MLCGQHIRMQKNASGPGKLRTESQGWKIQRRMQLIIGFASPGPAIWSVIFRSCVFPGNVILWFVYFCSCKCSVPIRNYGITDATQLLTKGKTAMFVLAYFIKNDGTAGEREFGSCMSGMDSLLPLFCPCVASRPFDSMR